MAHFMMIYKTKSGGLMKKLSIVILCLMVSITAACTKEGDKGMGDQTRTEYMLENMRERYDEEFVVDRFNFAVITSPADEWYVHVKDHPEIEAYVLGDKGGIDVYSISDNYYHVLHMKAYEDLANEVVADDLAEYKLWLDHTLDWLVPSTVNKSTPLTEVFTIENKVRFEMTVYTTTDSFVLDDAEETIKAMLDELNEKGMNSKVQIVLYESEDYKTLVPVEGGYASEKEDFRVITAYYDENKELVYWVNGNE
jgi:hypothetical protein